MAIVGVLGSTEVRTPFVYLDSCEQRPDSFEEIWPQHVLYPLHTQRMQWSSDPVSLNEYFGSSTPMSKGEPLARLHDEEATKRRIRQCNLTFDGFSGRQVSLMPSLSTGHGGQKEKAGEATSDVSAHDHPARYRLLSVLGGTPLISSGAPATRQFSPGRSGRAALEAEAAG